jgi:hypothetical protein
LATTATELLRKNRNAGVNRMTDLASCCSYLGC